MRLTQFGTYVFPLYNKRDNVSTGDASGALAGLPGGGTYDGYGTDQAPESPLELRTQFEIIETTATAVQVQRDAIRGRAGKYLRLWAHFPDGTDRFVWARLSKIKIERRREYIFYQPVELTFQVKTPGWNGTGHGAPWYLDAGYYIDAGQFLDLDDVITLDSSPKAVTIVNGGENRTVTAVILSFTAALGAPLSNITVTCGSCSWTWTGTVAATKTLSIDCGNRTIRNNGADAYNGFLLNAGHTVAEWLRLAAGNNAVTISFTCAGAASTLTTTYYDGWI